MNLNKRRAMTKLLTTIAVTFLSNFALALPDLPQHAKEIHLGVSSCASSTCHGAIQPRSSTKVLQNEYVVWSRMDSHSKAYQTLLSEESQWIAKNLGLANAHEAAVCLDCHGDNVSDTLQGSKFQMTDGVGCESCHGGAENYLMSHTDPGQSHADNLENGLYPTDQIESRAALCFSCHIGHEDKIASHEIMGAGHPRLSFELDTFTILQPAHFVVDEDYQEVKSHADSVTVWALGQIEASYQTVRLIESHLKKGGLFPELSLFDCHSCHHPMSDLKWQASDRVGLPPGAVRLNDAGFVMLIPLDKIAPGQPLGIKEAISELQMAVHQDHDIDRSINSLRSRINSLEKRVRGSNLNEDELLVEVLSMAADGQFHDYVAAEQAVMAIDLLISSVGDREARSQWLDNVYDSVSNEDIFDPFMFTEQFAGVK